MKKILCLCLALLLLCGCAQGEKAPYVPTGDGLTWDDETQPPETQPEEQELLMMYYPDRSMNPLVCADVTNRTLFSLLYQGLFATDSNYQSYPILCKRYTVSRDMRSYTFYLNMAVFSDGSVVMPEDVYETYQAAMDSPYYGGRFEHVYKLILEDDGGITFRLDTPCDDFPLLLDVPILKAEETDAEYPLGTGPYVFENTNAGARLRKRHNWWCKAELPVNASSIPLMEAKSETHIRDSFEFENVGLVCADPGSDSYADYRCDYELWDCENGNFLFLACNLESRAFSQKNLRSALTYAIDRNTLADEIYHGFARSATLPASPQSPYYNLALGARYEYNPEVFARAVYDADLEDPTPELLVDEGLIDPEDIVLPIRMLVNREDSLRLRVVRSIQKMLSACGMEVELLEYDAEDYFEALENGEYDLYLGQTRLSPNMDLSTFFAPDGNITYGGMSDPTIYSLCMDSLANRGNFYNLHITIANDGRLCPILFQSYSIFAVRGAASQLQPSRDNVFFYTTGLTAADILDKGET